MIKKTKDGESLHRPNILRKFVTIESIIKLREIDSFNNNDQIMSMDLRQTIENEVKHADEEDKKKYGSGLVEKAIVTTVEHLFI